MGRGRGFRRFIARLALGAAVVFASSGVNGPLFAQAEVTTVPLSLEGGWLIVPVEAADGRVLRFALHTAIPSTVVAASLGGDEPGSLALTFAGAATAFDEIGTLPDEAFTRGETHVDGFLGLHALGDVDVLIDVPGNRMLLRPIGRTGEWPGFDLAEPSRMRIYHGVALRTEIEVDGHPFSATIDLAAAAHTATEGVARTTGVAPGAAATVRVGSADHTMVLEFGSTPVLDRWDPEGAGFVAFGSPLAAGCAVAISYVHQELRTCVR